MAIIKCSNCGRDASDRAENCLYCKAPINAKPNVANTGANVKNDGFLFEYIPIDDGDNGSKRSMKSTQKQGSSSKSSSISMVIKICAVVLCVMFFLPLVRCSYDNSTASGWNIATGSGELMKEAEDVRPQAFVLLIIPIILFCMALMRKGLIPLRNVSIAGLLSIIIFMIWVKNARDTDGEFIGNYLQLTLFAWLILLIYLGITGITQYGSKLE